LSNPKIPDFFAIKWFQPRFHSLLIKQWETDEYFVFDEASGDTHLLNESAFTILELLAQTPLNIEQIIEKLGITDQAEQAEILLSLPPHIQNLAQIGLIEASHAIT